MKINILVFVFFSSVPYSALQIIHTPSELFQNPVMLVVQTSIGFLGI